MGVKHIWHGLGMIPCGFVNTYLIDGGSDGLVLVDTGFPGKSSKVIDGILNLGRQVGDVRHIVLTHAHADHIGGLGELAKATGAQTWIHEADAPIAAAGTGFRPLRKASEFVPGLMYRAFYQPGGSVEPARIDHEVKTGDVIPLAGGLRTIHLPGHCAGQIALLWEPRRVLIAGDVCTNVLGLAAPIGYEDEVRGRRDQRAICGFDYDLACFGHGSPLIGDATAKMRRRWLGETDIEAHGGDESH